MQSQQRSSRNLVILLAAVFALISAACGTTLSDGNAWPSEPHTASRPAVAREDPSTRRFQNEHDAGHNDRSVEQHGSMHSAHGRQRMSEVVPHHGSTRHELLIA